MLQEKYNKLIALLHNKEPKCIRLIDALKVASKEELNEMRLKGWIRNRDGAHGRLVCLERT